MQKYSKTVRWPLTPKMHYIYIFRETLQGLADKFYQREQEKVIRNMALALALVQSVVPVWGGRQPERDRQSFRECRFGDFIRGERRHAV